MKYPAKALFVMPPTPPGQRDDYWQIDVHLWRAGIGARAATALSAFALLIFTVGMVSSCLAR
jgi:hypothetical protein